MFDISWGEFLVLVVAGLFILGPERLPEAARWLGQTVRKVRDYASGARDKLQTELGPDLEEFREPLQELQRLQQLRHLDPRRSMTRHLLDATGGYDPLADLGGLIGGNGTTNGTKPPRYPGPTGPTGPTGPATQPPARPLRPNERPPFDPDAT